MKSRSVRRTDVDGSAWATLFWHPLALRSSFIRAAAPIGLRCTVNAAGASQTRGMAARKSMNGGLCVLSARRPSSVSPYTMILCEASEYISSYCNPSCFAHVSFARSFPQTSIRHEHITPSLQAPHLPMSESTVLVPFSEIV